MSDTTWVVWVGGIDDHYTTEHEAQAAAEEWRRQGYDDIAVERGQA
jgi:hypothetical protein